MIKRCFYLIITIMLLMLICRTVFVYFWPFAVGALLSLVVYPIVMLLFTYIKLPYKFSVVLGLIIVFISGPLILTGCIALLENEIIFFLNQIPVYSALMLTSLKNLLQSLPAFFHELTHPYLTHAHLTLLSDEIEQMLLTSGKQLITTSSKFASHLPSLLFSFGIMLIAAYYILVDFKTWTNKLPGPWARYFKLLRELGLKETGSYFISQLLLSSITFTITLSGFLILGIPHPFLFALLSAALDFVPIAGSMLLFLPLIIFNMVYTGPALAAGIMVIYLIIIGVRQVTEPKIIGDRMGIHPLAALMVLYASVELLGFTGIVITPLLLIFLSVLLKVKLFSMICHYIRFGTIPRI
ncbi:AI-2E family transporter [Jeotgalibacillus salarius]|uniref:AI-2E family transporter n=1 Tax=Jeotgalibacillus salarius TaxID=546023 RepID=A0A4Y8LFU7_9BACL|nr:AI-2E family transporter [Jeotgalibacillus salarius]TFE00940.1 AI-2E family transporter [Jeotgalibacillus salarius]